VPNGLLELAKKTRTNKKNARPWVLQLNTPRGTLYGKGMDEKTFEARGVTKRLWAWENG